MSRIGLGHIPRKRTEVDEGIKKNGIEHVWVGIPISKLLLYMYACRKGVGITGGSIGITPARIEN